MEWFDADGYTVARAVVQRGVAAVHVVAFVAVLRQFRPLPGERGLLPVPRFVARVPWRRSPSLFHLRYSDRLVVAVGGVGLVVAALLVAGVPQAGPPSLLLEAGFLAAFLGSDEVAPPTTVLVLLWWLVVRVELGAGLIKWRGDPAWRDLTALQYHHETQPMPWPLSRWFHLLPRPLHRVEVAANHVTQLLVPALLLVPGRVQAVAACVVVVTQLAWFMPFLARLLEADRPTLRLLARDPFAGRAPVWVRARLYRYRFATRAERRDTGRVWVREDLGLMVEPQDLATLARSGRAG